MNPSACTAASRVAPAATNIDAGRPGYPRTRLT